ncbi:Hypothetical protein Minf_0438 [Methylacidiphilum infernorum V4]|uniref:Uncharacterized protein n=1 Tax=Methylacidiphilum infernorum (isolate V4) TaxID=481448 RepID=B3DYX4_METI4|nr:Hypothetical protein Minf_0438 [Methylacidiphilum infernorum V4]
MGTEFLTIKKSRAFDKNKMEILFFYFFAIVKVNTVNCFRS